MWNAQYSVCAKPFAHARVEALDALPVEGMAGAFIQLKIATRNSRGDLFCHPDRSENIAATADDQTGAGNTLQLIQGIQGIVCDTSPRLSLEAMCRLRHGTGSCAHSPLLQLSETGILVPVRFGKDQELNIRRELLRAELALDAGYVPEQVARIAVTATAAPLGSTSTPLI
jgi:hypothetical protein